MVWLTLVIGVLNIALGAALAIYLEPYPLPVVVFRRREEALDAVQNGAPSEAECCTGWEATLRDWRHENPSGERQASVAAIDVDRFDSLAERLDPADCERLFARLSELLIDLVRKDRGLDVVARVADERFNCFFGDTNARSATSAVERIRQNIEQSTFELPGGEQITLTVSCAVVEITPTDTTDTLDVRLNRAMAEARTAGDNRTFLFVGEQPYAVEPPKYNVAPQTIRVEVE